MIHTVSICRREASRGRSLSNESRNDRKNGDVNQKKQLSHAFSHREQTILNEQVKVDDWGESIIQILYSENWSGGIRSALYWRITLIQAIRIKEEINISHSKAVLKATSALWKKSSTSFMSMKSVRLQGWVVTKQYILRGLRNTKVRRSPQRLLRPVEKKTVVSENGAPSWKGISCFP